jgi:hypothetical protein
MLHAARPSWVRATPEPPTCQPFRWPDSARCGRVLCGVRAGHTTGIGAARPRIMRDEPPPGWRLREGSNGGVCYEKWPAVWPAAKQVVMLFVLQLHHLRREEVAKDGNQHLNQQQSTRSVCSSHIPHTRLSFSLNTHTHNPTRSTSAAGQPPDCKDGEQQQQPATFTARSPGLGHAQLLHECPQHPGIAPGADCTLSVPTAAATAAVVRRLLLLLPLPSLRVCTCAACSRRHCLCSLSRPPALRCLTSKAWMRLGRQQTRCRRASGALGVRTAAGGADEPRAAACSSFSRSSGSLRLVVCVAGPPGNSAVAEACSRVRHCLSLTLPLRARTQTPTRPQRHAALWQGCQAGRLQAVWVGR